MYYKKARKNTSKVKQSISWLSFFSDPTLLSPWHFKVCENGWELEWGSREEFHSVLLRGVLREQNIAKGQGSCAKRAFLVEKFLDLLSSCIELYPQRAMFWAFITNFTTVKKQITDILPLITSSSDYNEMSLLDPYYFHYFLILDSNHFTLISVSASSFLISLLCNNQQELWPWMNLTWLYCHQAFLEKITHWANGYL